MHAQRQGPMTLRLLVYIYVHVHIRQTMSEQCMTNICSSTLWQVVNSSIQKFVIVILLGFNKINSNLDWIVHI